MQMPRPHPRPTESDLPLGKVLAVCVHTSGKPCSGPLGYPAGTPAPTPPTTPQPRGYLVWLVRHHPFQVEAAPRVSPPDEGRWSGSQPRLPCPPAVYNL